jgi:hypothetical protein
MKILKSNPKTALIAPLILVVFLLQNCKKTNTISPNPSTMPPLVGPMVAYINDTAWIANEYHAEITFALGFGTKTFYLYGVSGNKTIDLSAEQDNAPNTTGFPVNSHNYNYGVSLGVRPANSNTFYGIGATSRTNPGSSFSITAIDSVHQTISGIFSIQVYTNVTRDSNNQLIFLGAPYAKITSGKFTSVPYTYFPYIPGVTGSVNKKQLIKR